MKYTTRAITICLATLLFAASCQNANNNTKEKELQLKEAELKLKEQALIDEKKAQLEKKEKELADEKTKFEEAKRISPSSTPSQISTPGYKYYAKSYGRFPEASYRYIDYNDLKGLSSYDLKIMRNEIFARHGYIFKTNDMRQYFSGESWYRALYNDVTTSLSKIEIRNVDYIKSFE